MYWYTIIIHYVLFSNVDKIGYSNLQYQTVLNQFLSILLQFKNINYKHFCHNKFSIQNEIFKIFIIILSYL